MGLGDRDTLMGMLWDRVLEAAPQPGDQQGHWAMIHGHPVFIKGKGPQAGVPPQQPKPGQPAPGQPAPGQPAPGAQKPSAPKPQPAPPSKFPAGKPKSSDLWKSLVWKSSDKDKPTEKPKAWSPDEQKIHHLAKAVRKLGPLKRNAAGGIVFKNFDAKHPDDLEILVAKTHPKWGTPHWVLPKGGADPDEHIHDTASREVEEETGVKAKVIPGHQPLVRTSTFGDRGKYDLPLVVSALKKAHPGEEEFIDKMKDHLASNEHFTYENASHYFLMQHTGGSPIEKPDEHEEMSEARFMPLKDAAKADHKIGEIIKGMMPSIEQQWKAAGGSAQPARTESLYDRISRIR